MAWTAPMTALVGQIWTSADFNTNVRNNLNETMPGLASAAGNLYVVDAENSVTEKSITQDEVLTAETTTSTTYTDLTTVGPNITVTTGTKAFVWFNTQSENTVSSAECITSVAVSGDTSLSASDDWRIISSGVSSGSINRQGCFHFFDNLTAGSNTFTMKYKVSSGTGTFRRRNMIVLPL